MRSEVLMEVLMGSEVLIEVLMGSEVLMGGLPEGSGRPRVLAPRASSAC